MKSLYLIKPAFFLIAALVFTNGALMAQQTKNVAVTNFSEVSVNAGIELIITQGTTESAKIIAEEGVIDEVKIEKDGNRLNIGWKENHGFSWKNRSAKVYVYYKKLNGLSASSGSSLNTSNFLTTDRLAISVSSGASLNAKIACRDLDLKASSGSSTNLTGKAVNMQVEASSGSTIDALGLATEYARANTSSGSNIDISVAKGLETNSSSGSSINYKGNAALKNNSNSKSSSVSRIN